MPSNPTQLQQNLFHNSDKMGLKKSENIARIILPVTSLLETNLNLAAILNLNCFVFFPSNHPSKQVSDFLKLKKFYSPNQEYYI